jgi:penicillin amidase
MHQGQGDPEVVALSPERGRSRQIGRAVHIAVALGASAAVIALLAFGYGPVPALGPALVPGHGAWTAATGGEPVTAQTLALPGLSRPVTVWFTRQGMASVQAASDADAFLALGYLHARFRLAEMDVERRLGEGRLAALAGPSAVASDSFELRLGLLRTAQAEWAAMPRSSPAAQALIAYSSGVNDYLAQARASHRWPAEFSLAGVYPANWTPVDSLVVQGGLTQELDFTTTPLDYELLERSLGPDRTMQWFPVLPPNQQAPYDPGPYRKLGFAPLVSTGSPAASRRPDSGVVPAGGQAGALLAVGQAAGRPVRSAAPGPGQAGLATAARDILHQVSALPPGQLHEYPDSNAWAASGPRVAGGGALLAGDPHLLMTLPSVWYQVALSAPGLSVSGVSVPGLPGILLGHNQHIAWSLTDTQNQSALFYDEQTSPSHPGAYFWRGQWQPMRELHYTIAVRGGATRHLTVSLTVHGPVLTRAGQTVSVDWMGSAGSPDLAALLRISKASSFTQFRAALASWRAPTQNFVYADDRGNIGAISAGYFPLVRRGQPWLPMPGTGADDVAGVIPYPAVPQVYNPPGHVVATANQRPVGASYPYYIGTTANDFDPGYRAGLQYAYLTAHRAMSPAQFAGLQTSQSDGLAARIVPRLLAALTHRTLTPYQQQAEQLLKSWDYGMGAGSAAASLWWYFWTGYLADVFQPWWDARRVPVSTDRAGLSVNAGQASLVESLEHWTLSDPGNPAFTPPGRQPRNAAAVMVSAFGAAVSHLSARLHGAPASWTWGKLHSRRLVSVTGARPLGYGPRPAGGDPWTVSAADGGLVSTIGPSWRMITGWSGKGTPFGEGILPGGQSENPASPWYSDQLSAWWAGRYLPMPPAGGYPAGHEPPGSVRWELHP